MMRRHLGGMLLLSLAFINTPLSCVLAHPVTLHCGAFCDCVCHFQQHTKLGRPSTPISSSAPTTTAASSCGYAPCQPPVMHSVQSYKGMAGTWHDSCVYFKGLVAQVLAPAGQCCCGRLRAGSTMEQTPLAGRTMSYSSGCLMPCRCSHGLQPASQKAAQPGRMLLAGCGHLLRSSWQANVTLCLRCCVFMLLQS